MNEIAHSEIKRSSYAVAIASPLMPTAYPAAAYDCLDKYVRADARNFVEPRLDADILALRPPLRHVSVTQEPLSKTVVCSFEMMGDMAAAAAAAVGLKLLLMGGSPQAMYVAAASAAAVLAVAGITAVIEHVTRLVAGVDAAQPPPMSVGRTRQQLPRILTTALICGIGTAVGIGGLNATLMMGAALGVGLFITAAFCAISEVTGSVKNITLQVVRDTTTQKGLGSTAKQILGALAVMQEPGHVTTDSEATRLQQLIKRVEPGFFALRIADQNNMIGKSQAAASAESSDVVALLNHLCAMNPILQSCRETALIRAITATLMAHDNSSLSPAVRAAELFCNMKRFIAFRGALFYPNLLERFASMRLTANDLQANHAYRHLRKACKDEMVLYFSLLQYDRDHDLVGAHRELIFDLIGDGDLRQGIRETLAGRMLEMETNDNTLLKSTTAGQILFDVVMPAKRPEVLEATRREAARTNEAASLQVADRLFKGQEELLVRGLKLAATHRNPGSAGMRFFMKQALEFMQKACTSGQDISEQLPHLVKIIVTHPHYLTQPVLGRTVHETIEAKCGHAVAHNLDKGLVVQWAKAPPTDAVKAAFATTQMRLFTVTDELKSAVPPLAMHADFVAWQANEKAAAARHAQPERRSI